MILGALVVVIALLVLGARIAVGLEETRRPDLVCPRCLRLVALHPSGVCRLCHHDAGGRA